MTVLSAPRHPLIIDALDVAREWCAGHVIDQAPALSHAVRVAATIDQHVVEPAPELIAAALLHDAPYFCPDDIDLDAVLTTRFGPAVTQTVRALEREHAAMDLNAELRLDTSDTWTLYASAADKIVSLSSVLRRAVRSEDRGAYWKHRAAFIGSVPFFRAFSDQARGHLPAAMESELEHFVVESERAAAHYAL